ncbi:uncharacterized protein TNCV_4486961 [Trichonephila clavipes]|nr:uncharacterized protein TNCV_4486961 [Trichonephila clavipes]
MKTKHQKPETNLQEYTSELQRLTTLSFSDFSANVREMICLEYFVGGLKDEKIEMTVRMAHFKYLKSALLYTLKVETAIQASCIDHHSIQKARVTADDPCESGCIKGIEKLKEEMQALIAERQKQRSRSIPCWGCEKKISDLWELDSLGIKDPSEKKSKLELQDVALKHFENTVLRDDEDDVEDFEPLTPALFLQDIREVGVPEIDQIDENKLNKILVYRNRIQNDLRNRFRVEYLGQLRETRNIKVENTLSEVNIVLVGDDHTKRLNWNLVQKLYLLEVMEKKKSSVHPTNSPLFSDANEGIHLPINIDPELSNPRGRQPLRCSPVPVFLMVELDWSPELRHVDTSRQKPLRCSRVPEFLMGKPDT